VFDRSLDPTAISVEVPNTTDPVSIENACLLLRS
jgi:hypothetical protein